MNTTGGFFIAYDGINLLDGVRTPFVDRNSALGRAPHRSRHLTTRASLSE
jgi:hypothetical protein